MKNLNLIHQIGQSEKNLSIKYELYSKFLFLFRFFNFILLKNKNKNISYYKVKYLHLLLNYF